MKKRTKLLTGALTVLAGVLLLSSCTASFCSETDKAHILYAFDYGVSDYYDAEQEGAVLPEGAKPVFEGNTKVYYTVNIPTNNNNTQYPVLRVQQKERLLTTDYWVLITDY